MKGASVFVAVLLLAGPTWADLASVRAEPKLDKRAQKALDNADLALKRAEEAYRNGNLQESNTAFEELGESVVLADESLRDTGKNPSKSPKHFKKAEIRTRELLRKLNDFGQQMSFEDRGTLNTVRSAVQKVHEDLLLGIMGIEKQKKKRK